MAFSLRRTIGAHQAEVLCAAWSPDGNLLATGGADAAIQVRAFETGEIQRTIREHRNAVAALAFSHDGQRLASGSLDGTVVISSVARGMLVRRFVYAEPVRQVAFSPDDTLVAAASPNDNVRLWEVDTGDIHSELRAEKSHADALAWSMWNTIATGSYDGTVRIWDPQSGTVQGRLPAGGGERPTCITFFPDEGFVVGYASGLLRIVTNRIGLVDLGRHSGRIVGLSTSARGDRIATRSADGTVRLWSTRSGDVTDRIKDPPTHAVHAPVCFHPEEDVLATSSEDKKSMRIWNLAHRYATIPPISGSEPPEPPLLPTTEFDVFLCYNSSDAESVHKIARQLEERGLRPWLDVKALRPGLSWQKSLEDNIERIGAAAVFVGNAGIGPWQDLEIEAYLREFIQRRCPVIPVILPDCFGSPPMPLFLRGMHWVDFRKTDPSPIDQLVYGITGRRLVSED